MKTKFKLIELERFRLLQVRGNNQVLVMSSMTVEPVVILTLNGTSFTIKEYQSESLSEARLEKLVQAITQALPENKVRWFKRQCYHKVRRDNAKWLKQLVAELSEQAAA